VHAWCYVAYFKTIPRHYPSEKASVMTLAIMVGTLSSSKRFATELQVDAEHYSAAMQFTTTYVSMFQTEELASA